MTAPKSAGGDALFPAGDFPRRRMIADDRVLFPDIAPYDRLSAIATLGARHFVPMAEIEPDTIAGGFKLAFKYFRHFIVNATLKNLPILVVAVGLRRVMKSICHLWWVKRRQGLQIVHVFENVGRVLVPLAAAAL